MEQPSFITTSSQLREKLECEKCDGSTSGLEKEFVDRLTTQYYTPNKELHKIDALVFHIYGFRMLSMKNVLKNAVDDELASFKVLRDFIVRVWNIRKKLLQPVQCEKIDLRTRVLFHVLTEPETHDSVYQIKLALCNVDLTKIDPKLGCCLMIYGQACNCCWAVLLKTDQTAADLQRHFSERIVHRVNKELSQVKPNIEGIVMRKGLMIKV